MAGTVILSKHKTDSISQTSNLNITLHSIQAKLSCLWLQVAESNNSNKCNTNGRHMKEISTNNNHDSSYALDDSILTNYNYNIKTLKKKQQAAKQRPLTLSIAIIIVSLTVLLIQMPTMVKSKSFHKKVENKETQTEILAEMQPRKHIYSLTDEQSLDALDMLTSFDVLKHIERTQQHQIEHRMRLRKRHTGDLIITKYLHENAHNLEWNNPCNVDHVIIKAEDRHVTKQQVYQYLSKLESDIGMEYEFITATANTININDMADWTKHDELYKFLPKLNANGSIALSRWYRNMQVYVASFGYLARIQYNFDQHKSMFVGSTSIELNKLIASSRFLLCELETTINGSAPNNNLKKLRTISRNAINRRLDFVTKHQMANGGIVAVNTVDLKFAKFSYYQYLLNMMKVLNLTLQNKSKKYGIMASSNGNSTNNSNSILVGDDTSSLDFSSIFKSDSSLSLAESVEILLKTTKKPHTHRQRLHKRKQVKSPEV